MELELALSYADVLLKPRFSTVRSRSDVSIEVELSKGIKVKTPFIPANMKTIVNEKVIDKMCQNSSMTLMHRFDDTNEQLRIAGWIVDHGYENLAGMSVGIKDSDKQMLINFIQIGIKIICIDVAHADSEDTHNFVKWIADKYPSIFLIVGNVSTGEAAGALWQLGADAVKIGQGSGSICLTRIETGNGMPQFSALMEVVSERKKLQNCSSLKNKKMFIIADGGLTNAGSVVKALAVGADLVMAGNSFAGADESPGDVIELDGIKYKHYDGSSTYREKNIEGVRALTDYKGSLQSILDKFCDGLRSGLSYQGVFDLHELKNVAKFVRITPAAAKESDHHDVRVIKGNL